MLAYLKERLQALRSVVYDLFIGSTTSAWYREVLLECPMNSTMLDVGIGTGSSLIFNRDIVVSKNLYVTGVDYDLDYVKNAQANIAASSLCDLVRIEHANIHEFNTDYKEKYDNIYFSGSFMIIPDQAKALRHCVKMLRSPVSKVPLGCNIYFTQTFEKRSLFGSYLTPLGKRLLRALTTIDFGEVTYKDEFMEVLRSANVEIVSMRCIRSSWFREQMLVMARPMIGVKQ